MRFEAKHKELKVYCKVNYSRINICYSLAVRTSMKFSARLYNNQSFKLIQNVTGQITKYYSLGEKPYFRQIRPHCTDIKEQCNVTLCKSVRYKGSEHKKKYFLMQNTTEAYQIHEILFFNDFDLILIACTHSVKFDKNLNAFSVNMNESPQILLNISSLHKYFPMQLHTLGNSRYCRPKGI